MLRELLFNLWNNPGSVSFTEDGDWTHLFELPQFLHPCETELLQSIMKIGLDYHKITSFTNEILGQTCNVKVNQHVNSQPENAEKNSKEGFYLQAFCNGVQEALQDYRTELLRIEKLFLENPQLSMTYIWCSIDKYTGLFNLLKSMILKIQSEELKGCLILNGLHKYILCGVSEIEQAANIIIRNINTVFYQHLAYWIVYGNITDEYKEFFIRDGNCVDENFLYPEQKRQNVQMLCVLNAKIRRPPPVRSFFIVWNMMPTFINESCAESILFMGRIVWIIRNSPKNERVAGDYHTEFQQDIWEGKEYEVFNKIQSLCYQNKNDVKFKAVLEECRLQLTNYLREIMLNEGDLVGHLTLIRDYYALGRGELFQQFLTVLDTSLKNVSSNSFMQQLNFLFHNTARKIYGENDKSYVRFELAAPKDELHTSFKNTSYRNVAEKRPFQYLHLDFEIKWPLHIIFHPEVMEFYNKLFSYLLRLKRTQINLLNLWSKHHFNRQKTDLRVSSLRQNLLFLVNNLQYYLQVDVIEANFSTLLKAVESANEFEDIIKIHNEFVTNLLLKSFLLAEDKVPKATNRHRLFQKPSLEGNVPNKIYNVIINLLELCDQFCETANAWETELGEIELQELESFQKKSDIVIETLLLVLNSTHRKVSGDHLLKLLLSLDFNKYFSKNKIDLNLTDRETFKLY